MNRRIAVGLALAVVLVGCATEAKLLTAHGPQGVSLGDVGVVSGLLLPDGHHGTVLKVDGSGRAVVGFVEDGRLSYGDTDAYLAPVNDGRTFPVTWPEGYTARRSVLGGEVEVLNTNGEVVARTGRRYVCAHHVDGSWGACAAAEAVSGAVGSPPPVADRIDG